jgi:DNA invertase Pin-like site-specific DNA recombinase
MSLPDPNSSVIAPAVSATAAGPERACLGGGPESDRLLKDVVRSKIDVVAGWSIDRLGRSLQDLVAFLGELNGASGDLYLEKQAIDTTTPSGRMLFQMLGVFAEFERALIQ